VTARRWVPRILVVAATLRFLGTCVSAIGATHGDFYATLPGAYVERLNPTLWNSPDLRASWAFHQPTYLHGPAQYLTLYPIAFLDSYRAIAALLLVIYAGLVIGTVFLLRRMLEATTGRPLPLAGIYTITLLFVPVLQAFGQREFEVVTLVVVIAAFAAAATEHPGVAGGLFAYISAFKYAPVLVVPYFVARRWWRALIAYGIVALLIATAAHAVFGLPRFFNNNVPSLLAEQLSIGGSPASFCEVWTNPATHHFALSNQTYASLRWGLCNLHDRHPGIPLPLTYLLVCAAVAVTGLAGFVRLERGAPLAPEAERWRRVLELSTLVIVYTTFFFAHFYYLSALLVPVTALSVRFLHADRLAPIDVSLWAIAYVLLAAFLVPSSVVAKVVRVDLVSLYARYAIYVYGELLLLGLVLREYLRVPVTSARPVVARISRTGCAGNDCLASVSSGK
jgi:hypothetical protein